MADYGNRQQAASNGIPRLLGVPEGSPIADQLARQEFLQAEIANVASNVMCDDENYREVEVHGTKYHVSISAIELTGSGSYDYFTQPDEDDEDVIKDGFQLATRVYRRSEQDDAIIYLIKNGNFLKPVATISVASRSVNVGDEYTGTDDVKLLASYLEIVTAIQKNSDRREQAENDDRRRRRHRRGKIVGTVAVGLGIIGGAIFGATKYNEAQDANSAREARIEAENKAQKLADEQASAEQARINQQIRESEIRTFDADTANSVQAEQAVSVDEISLVQPSTQFDDVEVPTYGEKGVNSELSHDLSSTRQIELEYDKDGQMKIMNVDMSNLEQGQSFRIVHNGDSNRAIMIHMDPRTNTMTIYEAGANLVPNNQLGQAPSHIFIQSAANG